MTDPAHALQSFQQALLLGGIKLRRGELDKDLYVYVDGPDGQRRFTYVRLEGRTVTAFVELAWCEPIEGTPCLAIGYAVPEAYRNQGRAKESVRAALAEMQHGLLRNGISVFYVEAIVGADNKPSQRVAKQVISDKRVSVKDRISDLPAFQYVRKVEPNDDKKTREAAEDLLNSAPEYADEGSASRAVSQRIGNLAQQYGAAVEGNLPELIVDLEAISTVEGHLRRFEDGSVYDKRFRKAYKP